MAGHTRVCDCLHSTVTACLADQHAQDIHLSTHVQWWIVKGRPDNIISERQRWQSTDLPSDEQFAPALPSLDLSQFTSSGHYEHAWPPSTLKVNCYDNALYKCTIAHLTWLDLKSNRDLYPKRLSETAPCSATWALQNFTQSHNLSHIQLEKPLTLWTWERVAMCKLVRWATGSRNARAALIRRP